MNENIPKEYPYVNPDPTWSSYYLWPVIGEILKSNQNIDKRVFEIGCGNGATANYLADIGFEVTGIDPSKSGIEIANKTFPGLNVYEGSAYDDLAAEYGKFPIVVSLEVVEHCFYPRRFAKTLYDLLEDDGVGIISTPYHGYWKNLALALTGKMDAHFTALWDGGHIKFFSEKTLRALLMEAGFKQVSFVRAGRISMLAKSMIAVVRK